MYWPVGAPRCFAQQQQFAFPAGSHGHRNRNGADQKSSQSTLQSVNDVQSIVTGKDDTVKDTSLETSDGKENLPAALGDGDRAYRNEKPRETLADSGSIIGMRVARNGQVFATLTQTTLTIWQTQPTAILTSIVRSARSLRSYGINVSLLLRPDADTVVLQTALGYLITYSILMYPSHCAYSWRQEDGDKKQVRRRSIDQVKGPEQSSLLNGGGVGPSAGLRFRMVIKLDAGISKALALDNELVIATRKPAAIQCVRWTPDRDGSQTNTELLSRMDWLNNDTTLEEIVYDRPMNLFTFITNDGYAYTVQRLQVAPKEASDHKPLFKGHRFHCPSGYAEFAIKAAVNSRFSLIAVGCADGSIWLYTVRDYTGGVSLLRRIPPPSSQISGSAPTALIYSPDGYCLFAGYEKGWTTCSVYGQSGGSSFGSTPSLNTLTGDAWLTGVADAFWVGGGSDVVMLDSSCSQLWFLEFARSAVTGCFGAANVSKAMLQTSTGFKVYRGHQMPDLFTIAADVSLWENVKAPVSFVAEQWPLRAAVVSPDGRYLAIAGQRGLAHYSFTSARWKMFDDKAEQDSFFVRGGMCWHHHILIATIECAGSHELRVYSRESPLSNANVLQIQALDAPAVHLASSGEDSILIYTYDNVLSHYIVAASKKSVELIKVGQIALQGIIRAPPRVRGVSWVVPEQQLQNGDSGEDVATASVFFLIDGKLVLLQPSASDDGGLKYDMRIIAHHVEYYMLARDVSPLLLSQDAACESMAASQDDIYSNGVYDNNLDDSLWLYDGENVKVWPDVNELLNTASNDLTREIEAPISIPVDFYPLSALLRRGILFGVEAELVQRRDASFASFRAVARTTLFLPQMLEHYLTRYDTSAALNFSYHYRSLPYFAHALEMLLHNVLDEEVENPPAPDEAMLPGVLSFLSSFPEYLDIIVQCARKTELRSWRTLFAHLPPPIELFQLSLERGSLKTAGGYLLVLHNLEDVDSTSPQVVRLLRAAKAAEDWDLCKELARFLVALDESGATLKEALELVDLASPAGEGSMTPLGGVNDTLGRTNGSRTGLGIITGTLRV